MPTLTISPPNEKQKIFLKETHKYVGFGGARGGGKSWVTRVKAVLLAFQYPGIKIMIVRKTYVELQENHIMPLCTLLHCYDPDRGERFAGYNDSKKHITFDNGSRIIFRYCDNDKDAERFQGTEVDVMFIDEATHQSEERVKKLIACVRGVNDFPKRVYFTANPGSLGHEWFKRLFIDRKFRDNEKAEDYVFIKSLVTDNLALMKENPDYLSQLEALPPKLRKMWLEGDWNCAEGIFFEEFADLPDHYLDRQWTHVIEPFEIPKDWTIFRCFDWGFNKPFACEWFAMDMDGVFYNILECYGCNGTPNEGVKWIPDEVFAKIHEIETEHRWLKGKHIYGVADPAIWDAQYGESVAETAEKHQVYFSKGDHERIPGWLQFHYRLHFDEDSGTPMMYFFSNCKNAIRTIPLMMYDEHKPEDIDTSMEDHICDAIRYLLMSRAIKPTTIKPKDKHNETPMAMYLDIPKSDIIAKPKVGRMEIIKYGN